MDRIYLDNAATSWPKPESVYRAVDQFQRSNGSSAGRGAYREVKDAMRVVSRTRRQISQFINAEGNRNNIAFTYSGTDALTTAIRGLVRPGDHVVTSVAEHNSVLRPLRFLESYHGVEVTRVGVDAFGYISAADVIAGIKPHTKLVVLSHVSNLTGAIQPVVEVGRYCKAKGIVFLLDAAQSIGHLPMDVREIGCDLLAAPGHKALLAPLGTGFLYYSPSVADQIWPLRLGGTGTAGGFDQQPAEVPSKFESGSLNVPGIVGLYAGIQFLNSPEGRERLEATHALSEHLLSGLKQINGVRVQGSLEMANRLGVFSISFDRISHAEAAIALDARWSIQTRAGLHCAPLLHRALGSESVGGTVRLSVGLFNTRRHIEVALQAISCLATPSVG